MKFLSFMSIFIVTFVNYGDFFFIALWTIFFISFSISGSTGLLLNLELYLQKNLLKVSNTL